MPYTDLTGLAGIALAAAVVLHSLSGRPNEKVKARAPALVLGGLFVLMLLPLPLIDLPFAGYVRGAIGDLSITSVLLLALVAASRCGLEAGTAASGSDPMRKRASLLLPLAAGCALYPLALGATQLDPYQWGFGEPWFLAALLLVAILAKLLRLPLVAASIALAVLAWVTGWYESANLWDYLLDPMLCLFALGRLLAMTVTGSQKQPT